MDKETEIKLEKRIKSLEKQMGAIFLWFQINRGHILQFQK